MRLDATLVFTAGLYKSSNSSQIIWPVKMICALLTVAEIGDPVLIFDNASRYVQNELGGGLWWCRIF